MSDYPRRNTPYGALSEERRRNRVKGIRQEDVAGPGGMSLLKARGVFDVPAALSSWITYTIDGVAGSGGADAPYDIAIPTGDWVLNFTVRFMRASTVMDDHLVLDIIRNGSDAWPAGPLSTYWLRCEGSEDTRSFSIDFPGGDLLLNGGFWGDGSTVDPDDIKLDIVAWGRT